MRFGRSCMSIVVLATIGIGSAAGGGYRVAYAYPHCAVPVYATWSFAYPAPYVYSVPLIVAPVVPLAAPMAAPPSKVQMPPAGKSLQMAPVDGPSVTEARSRTGEPTTLPKDRCRVGFWNLTGADVTLVVDGQSRLLPRNRAITLELAREFVWRVGEQPARTERVDAEKSTYEVVIR